MVSCSAEVHDGKQGGGLSRGGSHGTDASFQLSHLLLEGCHGGISGAGILVARFLESEESLHLVEVFILVGGGLGDRQRARLAHVGCVTALDAEGARAPMLSMVGVRFVSHHALP